MTGRWQPDLDDTALAGATAISRGPEHAVAAYILAALTLLAGLIGSVNLFVEGSLHQGATRLWYAAGMAACLAAAGALALRRRAGPWQTFGLVLLCDLVYVIVVLCIAHPVQASPLLLLFPSVVAAWFLGPWMVGTTMGTTLLACTIAVIHTYDGALLVGMQVLVDAGVLDIAALAIFVLRRRVQRLLLATRALSHSDPLTGLYNRRHLVEQAPRLWRQARRDGMRVTAMVLDLDHFKRLNDAHGHAAGDAVLQAVAASLTAGVRPSDVLARTGGEELVVLGLVSDHDEAAHLAERLRVAVACSRTPDGRAVTASIGIALTRPVDDEDVTDALWRLVDRADAAMYAAKQQGRDRVVALTLPRARTPQTGELSVATGNAGTGVA